jgi:MFS family permease
MSDHAFFSRAKWALLKKGPFRRYLIGEGISMTGTWMQAMAQAWILTTLTNKAVMLGMMNFCAGLPMLMLTMFGGSVADRYDKRKILIFTQIVQIALAVFVGFLVATHRIQIWHMFGVAVLLGISTSFEMPAASALVPELVDKEHISTAIALDRSIFHATRLIGPAFAGILIGIWGVPAAFFANALSFIALIIALMTIHLKFSGSHDDLEKRKGGIKDGIAYVRSEPLTLSLIGLMAGTTVFVFPVMVVMLPLYARLVLGLGPDKMGFLMSITGIGAVVGSVGLMAFKGMKHLRLCFCILGGVIGLLGLALAREFTVAACSLVTITISVSTLVGLCNIIVQERAPSHLRGRISAIAGLSFFGFMPIAGLVVTSLSDLIGMRKALAVSGVIYGVMGLIILLGPARKGLREMQ